MNALLPYAATALGPALRNLSRKRLLALGKYAYNRGAFYHSKYNALSDAQKAFISGTARKAVARLRQKKRRARKIAAFRNMKRPRLTMQRPIRMPRSVWAKKDIRITRKASLVLSRLQSAVQSTDTQQTFWTYNEISNNALFQPIQLKTIRTYYEDEPFYIDISKFIHQTAQPLLNQDATQSAVDIQSITFAMTYINYQPDVDMKLRMMLLRRNELNSRDVNTPQTGAGAGLPQGTSVSGGLIWSDFWNDRVDKRDKYDFNHNFSDVDYSTNYKDYSAPNTTIYKIWKQKNVTLKSNPHTYGTLFTNGIFTHTNTTVETNQQGTLEQHDPHMDEDIQNEYAPNIVPGTGANIVSHDMQVSRIRGYPGQNEKTTVMSWIPKGGYRMQFVKSDIAGENPEVLYPKDDLRFLIMPFEQTKDPRRKQTQHELGYRIEVNIKYKDLL